MALAQPQPVHHVEPRVNWRRKRRKRRKKKRGKKGERKRRKREEGANG